VREKANPGVIAIAVIVLVALVAFIGWRSFGPKGDTLSQASVDSHWQAKKAGPNR